MIGSVDDVVDWLERGLSSLEMTMHYVLNIDVEISGDTATVRAQFFNPMQIPGLCLLYTSPSPRD